MKIIILCFLTLSLLGCSYLNGFSYKQQYMLKKEGFKYEADGWSLKPVLFNFDEDIPTAQGALQTKELALRFQKYDLHHLKIIGYSDNIGTEKYNLKLSEQRAESIARIFIENGFKATDIIIQGKGFLDPISPNTTKENRASNRRVAIIVLP